MRPLVGHLGEAGPQEPATFLQVCSILSGSSFSSRGLVGFHDLGGLRSRNEMVVRWMAQCHIFTLEAVAEVNSFSDTGRVSSQKAT